jgi:SAM-dependent methyltransferase
MRAANLIMPTRLKPFRAYMRNGPFTLLDVGCGAHSPTITKRWFPNVRYHGIDRERYHNDDADIAAMDRFFCLDLEESDLSEVEDGAYDAVLGSHVIEHLANGLEVVARLAGKLRPGGGVIYLEFPSVRSLSIPSGRKTLNFCDDSTHKRVYEVSEVANVLLANRVRILKAGRRRDSVRLMLTPAILGFQLYSIARYGQLDGPNLWDLLGFADFVLGERTI